ncbi:MAG: ribonuclease R, partial [Gemmataceae bacterium]
MAAIASQVKRIVFKLSESMKGYLPVEYYEKIIEIICRKNYVPMKPGDLARRLHVPKSRLTDYRRTLRKLLREGRIEIGKNQTIRESEPHGAVTGTFRRLSTGKGVVRPHSIEGVASKDIFIREQDTHDAATGDTVLVRLLKKPARKQNLCLGKILQVIERATRQFVGTYFERNKVGMVRVDGTVFSHSIEVGDPGAKRAFVGDKVVLEMVRFPTAEDRGEGVITEVLGAHGNPGVDTLSIIRSFDLPDHFPEDAWEEARQMAESFSEENLEGREDHTRDLVITIDPYEARDFDDAVSVSLDEKTGHWELMVHIADVSRFAPQGGALDREARKRATSVYLPQRVLPMFPEIISNNLASLQPDRVRFVKSVIISFTPEGKKTSVRLSQGAIRSRRRFTYEEVMQLIEHGNNQKEFNVPTEIYSLILRMRDLALILRQRRKEKGSLELQMPEAELEYDAAGKVVGGHFRKDDISHQIIEEFMLAANEAVAEQLQDSGIPFLRRIHPSPDPARLSAFADFTRSLGYKISSHLDRFSLQKILSESANRPEVYAVHYALLRSLKQAKYSPEEEGHYALAIENYCHFTSPIRRYPDLVIHRMIEQRLKRGKISGNFTEMLALGEHCSKMERRAEMAERELIKIKLLSYLSDRVGMEMEVIITGVADYGFFAQAEQLPIEGLVHISTLQDDFYFYEEETHSLTGRRFKRHF